jgi:hypothetical protein
MFGPWATNGYLLALIPLFGLDATSHGIFILGLAAVLLGGPFGPVLLVNKLNFICLSGWHY